jgi:hypothetical protein
MNVVLKKSLTFIFALLLIVSFSFPTFASESEISTKITKNTTAISESQKVDYSKYVFYDSNSNKYILKDSAKTELNPIEYNFIKNSIDNTNSALSEADLESSEVSIITPDQEKYSNLRLKATKARKHSKYHHGVTKVDFHWWGVTVYLSKTTIKYMGRGATIAGIWIPNVLAGKIASTMGVTISTCPGGIAFDYSYAAAGISKLTGGTLINWGAVRNIRWQ